MRRQECVPPRGRAGAEAEGTVTWSSAGPASLRSALISVWPFSGTSGSFLTEVWTLHSVLIATTQVFASTSFWPCKRCGSRVSCRPCT